jgi:hypothetical protein
MPEPKQTRVSETMAREIVDRLTHRAHIIDTGTESWRFRHGLTRKRT